MPLITISGAFIMFVYNDKINIRLIECVALKLSHNVTQQIIVRFIGTVFAVYIRFRMLVRLIKYITAKPNQDMIQQIYNISDFVIVGGYVVLYPVIEIDKMESLRSDGLNAFTLFSMSFIIIKVNVVLFLVLGQTICSTFKQFTVCKSVKCDILKELRDNWALVHRTRENRETER